MADLQRLEEGLRNADAAGDTAAAAAFADAIKKARGAGSPAQQPQQQHVSGGIRDLILNENARSLGVPAASQQPQQAEPGTQLDGNRLVGLFGRGATDSVLGTIAAPVQAATWLINRATSQHRKLREEAGLDVPGGSQRKAIERPFAGRDMLLETRDAAVGSMPPPQTTGEKLAYGAGHGVGDAASIFVPAGAIANTAKQGTMAQGLASTLSKQPILQAAAGAAGGGVGEATDNPLLGLAAALAVPAGYAAARRFVSPDLVRLGDLERSIVAAAKKHGIPLNLEQQTGNKTVGAINSVLRKLPFSGDMAQNADDATRAAFNRAVLRQAGIDAKAATPEVLDDGFRVLGRSFDDLIARTPEIRLDQKFFSSIDDVVNSYGRRLPSNVSGVFQSFVDDLNTARQAMNSGGRVSIDGDTYRRIYSDMARVIRTSNDRELVGAVGRLRGALDDAMTASVPKELAESWKDVRRAYATLTSIAKAVAKGPQGAEATGNIPFGAFRNEVRGRDPVSYARGKGPLNELARIGGYLSDKVPDSGTAQRTFIGNVLTGGGVGSGFGAAMGNPVLGAAAGVAAPPAVYGMLNNPLTRAYMTNQLAAGSGVSREAIGGLLGARGLEQLKELIQQQNGAP